MVSIYLYSNFSDGLWKTISASVTVSRSKSSKVIDFGTNRKRVCDFLLVRNLGPILHRFGDMAAFMCSWPHPYSTLILGVFPLHQIAHVGVNVSRDLRIFGRETIFEVFQTVKNIPRRQLRHGRTDGQTTCNLITAQSVCRPINFWIAATSEAPTTLRTVSDQPPRGT